MCPEEKKKRPSNNLLLSLLSTPSTLFDKEPKIKDTDDSIVGVFWILFKDRGQPDRGLRVFRVAFDGVSTPASLLKERGGESVLRSLQEPVRPLPSDQWLLGRLLVSALGFDQVQVSGLGHSLARLVPFPHAGW